jgi:hypothetical protein
MKTFANYIKQETLSDELVNGLSTDGTYGERQRIATGEISLAIKRANPKH